VDVKILSSADVSREHARIRRDAPTGRFFLIDLSSLGTTLNGRHVPRGVDDADGAKKENGAETPLPDRARIGLADTVHLDFELVRTERNASADCPLPVPDRTRRRRRGAGVDGEDRRMSTVGTIIAAGAT